MKTTILSIAFAVAILCSSCTVKANPTTLITQPINDEVERQLSQLPRESIARPAIENNSYIAVMDSVEDMFTVMNEVAPEHLEIQLPDPMEYMSMVENAGSVFLGRYASEPLELK